MKACWFCGCTEDRACLGGCYWLKNQRRPNCSRCPTRRQIVVLKAVYRDGRLRAITKAIGGTSTRGAHDHLSSLQKKGLLELDPRFWGRRRLTVLGLAAIGLRPCSCCRGSGVLSVDSAVAI